MKYVLAYTIRIEGHPTIINTAHFDERKSAQIFDSFLKRQYGRDAVVSYIIYDGDEEK